MGIVLYAVKLVFMLKAVMVRLGGKRGLKPYYYNEASPASFLK